MISSGDSCANLPHCSVGTVFPAQLNPVAQNRGPQPGQWVEESNSLLTFVMKSVGRRFVLEVSTTKAGERVATEVSLDILRNVKR